MTRPEMDAATVQENTRIALAAVESLGRLRDPDALWPLMDLFDRREEPPLLFAVAEAIATIGGEDARLFFADVSLSEDSAKRRAAARGLGRLDDPGAESTLWRLSRDEDPSVRSEALAALGAKPIEETLAGGKKAPAEGAPQQRRRSDAQLAAEIAPDGVPVYRPVSHRVLGDPDETVSQSALR